jgi:hypothetical protein
MTHTADIRPALLAVSIICGCFGLFTSAVAEAGGLSIQYSNQGHGVGIGHHQSHGAVGNVRIKRHSHHNYSNNHQKHQKHKGHSYRYNSYPRYRSYTSPSQRYYKRQYAQPYLDSRFPNSYRNYSYYQQTQPRYYGNNYSDAVNAWEILAQGQTRIALTQFGREAQSYPKAGMPKLGFALSSAASGDLNQGVIAMRRAFKIDSESLRYYQLDQRLHPMIHDLIGKYQYRLNHRGRRKDEAFMVAALNYLSGDYNAAHNALERAKRDGDRSHSFRYLREFLNETQVSTTHSDKKYLYKH